MFYHAVLSPYEDKLMGNYADAIAEKYGFTREQQDAFATESVRRALAASDGGAFKKEITPVTVKDRIGEHIVELPIRATLREFQPCAQHFLKLARSPRPVHRRFPTVPLR